MVDCRHPKRTRVWGYRRVANSRMNQGVNDYKITVTAKKKWQGKAQVTIPCLLSETGSSTLWLR